MRILASLFVVLCSCCITFLQSQTVFNSIENQPAMFSGGVNALFEYFGQQYDSLEDTDSPYYSLDNIAWQGLIIVRIGILADGSIGEVYIDPKTPTPYQDSILQKVKKMPKWKPAIKDGEPIDSEYLFPLKLRAAVGENYIGPSAPDLSTRFIEYIPVIKSPAIPNIDYYDFVSKNLSYPEDALDAGIQGRVVAFVIVGSDGRVENVEIVEGIHPSCDDSVRDLIHLIPSWTPAILEGEFVKSEVLFPIVFRFQ